MMSSQILYTDHSSARTLLYNHTQPTYHPQTLSLGSRTSPPRSSHQLGATSPSFSQPQSENGQFTNPGIRSLSSRNTVTSNFAPKPSTGRSKLTFHTCQRTQMKAPSTFSTALSSPKWSFTHPKTVITLPTPSHHASARTSSLYLATNDRTING